MEIVQGENQSVNIELMNNASIIGTPRHLTGEACTGARYHCNG